MRAWLARTYAPASTRFDEAAEEYDVGIGFEPEVLVTAGATEGVFAAMQAFVDPGDEVRVRMLSSECACCRQSAHADSMRTLTGHRL